MNKLLAIRDSFAVLLWRDACIIRNSASRILAEPFRLVGWLLWLAYLAYCVLFRGRSGVMEQDSAQIALDVAATIFLLVMSLSLLRGEMPPAPFFESVTEARFLTTSQVEPWIISVYFQFRNALRRFPSMAIFLAYVITLAPIVHRDPFSIVLAMTTIFGTLFLSRVFSLPREFSTGAGLVFSKAFGCATLALALLSGAQVFDSLVPISHPALWPALHIGQVFILGTRSDPRTALMVYGLNIFAFVWGAIATRGKYPELYSLSVEGWSFRRRLREGNRRAGLAGLKTLARSATARIPGSMFSGPAIGLWMNWLMFRRSMPLWWIIMRPGVAFAVGYVAVHTVGDLLELFRAFGFVIALTILTTAVTDATRIGKELRQPLFWLTDAPLQGRLFMSVLGWYWRSATDISLFFVGALAAGSAPALVLVAVTFALSGVWLQRCISAASFAVLPNSADLGGPIFLARMFFTALCSVPPGVLGVVLATVLHNVAVGFLAACVVALIESAALLSFAAGRLAGRFDRILG